MCIVLTWLPASNLSTSVDPSPSGHVSGQALLSQSSRPAMSRHQEASSCNLPVSPTLYDAACRIPTLGGTSPCELAARIYAILMLVHAVTALVLHSTTNPSRIRMGLPPVDPMQLDVVNNEDEVATVVCNRLESAAKAAIAERGHFALAIPGGSVMKMLEGTSPSWADQCTLAYVNHKAVPMDDEALSTHAKASSLFLEKGWSGANVITLTGSADPAAEAASYAQQLQSLPEMTLPREDGTPVFDLILIGVGDDGHVRHNLGLTHANIACA